MCEKCPCGSGKSYQQCFLKESIFEETSTFVKFSESSDESPRWVYLKGVIH